MANGFHNHDPYPTPAPAPQQSAPAPESKPEPLIHCWPHPVITAPPTQEADTSAHFIRCALSYQNELLAEIKALLEQIVSRDGGTP